MNTIILNGNKTTAPCVQCGEDAEIQHGRSSKNGAPAHNVACHICGEYFVYIGYYCPKCVPQNAAQQAVAGDAKSEEFNQPTGAQGRWF